MRRVRLKHVADVTAGQSPESADVTYASDGLPFLQGCAEFGAKFPTSEKYCLNPPRTARKGSWLISVRAPVGSINLADQDYCIGRGLAAVYPNAADQGYLGYVLFNQGGFLNAISTGSTFQAISTFQLKNVEIELPPLDTQRRIARFLDEKTARIDGLIEKKGALLDRLAEKRQALITRAVTKGLNPGAPMKPSGIHWLGDIPAHWVTAALGYRYTLFIQDLRFFNNLKLQRK
jgi:type I restriction enzyme S subunit